MTNNHALISTNQTGMSSGHLLHSVKN